MLLRSRLGGFSALLVLAAFALAIALYPALPERFAVHWDAAGNPNRFGGRLSVFELPAIMLAVHVLFTLAPKLSPRGFEAETSQRALRISHQATLAFLLMMHAALALSAAKVIAAPPEGLILPALGLLLAVLGNYFGKLRRNFFLGIRTPWTLSDEEVWLRTHRMSGKLFVAVGGLTMAAGLLGKQAIPYTLLLIVSMSLVPFAYSFVIYRRLHAQQ